MTDIVHDRRDWAPMLSGLAFLVSAVMGLAVSRGTGGFATLWPANAVLLAALLLTAPRQRWRHVASCLLASIAANFSTGETLGHALLFTAANLMTPMIAVHLLRTVKGDVGTLQTPRAIRSFLIAVSIAVAVGATVAAAGLALDGASFAQSWESWASSDLLGILLIVPVILVTARRIDASTAPRQQTRWLSVLWPYAMLAVGTFIVFSQSKFPLLFVPLALVVLVTFRLGLLGAVAGTGVVAIIGTAMMNIGTGPVVLISGSIALRIQFFQFYLMVIYATCLPLATLLAERTRLARLQMEGERRHRRILDRSREVVFETDVPGRWTYLNPAWEVLVGRSRSQSLDTSFLSLIVQEDRPAVIERVSDLHAQKVDACHQEVRFHHADGSIRWASVRSHLLFDEAGVVVGTYGTLHDITDAKRVEEERAKSEKLYRLLADNSNDMIVRISLLGVRLYVSPACQDLLGYRPEELVGETPAAEIHPDDRPIAIATCQTLLSGTENPICTYRQRHRDGHYVWLEASYRLIRDPSGQPIEFIASVRNVARRLQAELDKTQAASELRENNRLLLMAEEMGQIGHWRVDLGSGTAIWSDVVCAIHGVDPGHSPPLAAAIDHYHPDDRAMVQNAVNEAVAGGSDYEVAARLIRTDGAIRHVIARGRLENAPDGTPLGLVGVIQDVTETHEAGTAIREAGERLAENNRLLMMAESVAHLGHWRIDDAQKVNAWSQEVYHIFGLPTDEPITTQKIFDAYHPDDRERVRGVVARAIATGSGYSFTCRVCRPDGTIVHVFVRGERDWGEDGRMKGAFGIIQDVSEQAEGETLLRRSEERFRLLTEQASDMISVHDFDGCCRFMSPAARTILGHDPADLVGHSLPRFVLAADRRRLSRYRAQLERAVTGAAIAIRFQMRHAAGHLVWIEAVSRQARYDDKTCLIAVCRDVSDQVAVEAELEAARRAAEEAARAKSMFLANMSHEIRTPMNGVVGFTELLLTGDLSADQRRQAELIAESSRAMMRLLNDILDLSKVEAGQMKVVADPFDLHHLLRACVKLMTPAVEHKGLALRCVFAPDLPKTVIGDGLRLRQIILNLLGNAAKFTAEGSVTLQADTVIGADGPAIVITVEDTGIGIAPDRLAAIFEQFVQADTGIAARFGGTGLGLAISAQLARLMDGTLRVESEVGRRTRFTLTLPLPVADDMVAAIRAPARPASVAVAGTPARILVAEDHDINQLLITQMLKAIGADAYIAADGAQAIDMVAAAQNEGMPYRLILMDMQMPVVDGITATRQIRASGIDAATLPIIALTANAYADDVAACVAAGMQAHLAKPVNMTELATALQRWIADPVAAIPAAPAIAFSAALTEKYRDRKQQALDQLDHLVRTGTFEDVELSTVAATLHKLAGSAAMFGDVALGEEARAFERGLEQWDAGARPARIVAAVAAIGRAA